MKKIHFAFAALTLISATAFAQDSTTSASTNDPWNFSGAGTRWDDNAANRSHSYLPWTSYGYVGAGGGTASYHNNCSPGLACDRSDGAWKIFTGGEISRVFGVELGYVNLGEGRLNGGNVRAQGINLDLIANLPLGNYFNVFAKAGGIYGWTRTSGTLVPIGENGHEDGLNWHWGAGAQLDFNRYLALRLDYDRYRLDYVNHDDQTSAVTGNLVFKY